MSLEELWTLGWAVLLEDTVILGVVALLEFTEGMLLEEATTVPLLDCATLVLLVADGVPVGVPFSESLEMISPKPSSAADEDTPVSVEER